MLIHKFLGFSGTPPPSLRSICFPLVPERCIDETWLNECQTSIKTQPKQTKLASLSRSSSVHFLLRECLGDIKVRVSFNRPTSSVIRTPFPLFRTISIRTNYFSMVFAIVREKRRYEPAHRERASYLANALFSDVVLVVVIGFDNLNAGNVPVFISAWWLDRLYGDYLSTESGMRSRSSTEW